MKKLFAALLIGMYLLSFVSGLAMLKEDYTMQAAQKPGLTKVVKEETVEGLPDQKPAGNVTPEDIDLVAKAVNGEARGEPFQGQVAIAAVILNRVESSKFPGSVQGVIYQTNAFTAVNDGQIDLLPDSTAYQAVYEALKGKDPSGGALYYYNPAKTTNKWIWSRPVINQIGDHLFAI